MEVISVIHSIMAVAMSLWTYSRYSRRCATSYGDDFVFGHVKVRDHLRARMPVDLPRQVSPQRMLC